MWVLFMRPARPDAVVWEGRVGLAVIDALVWPAFWIVVVLRVPFATGLAGAVFVACLVLVACGRIHRAGRHNERYRFTTWRWGVPLAALLLAGLIVKLSLFLR